MLFPQRLVLTTVRLNRVIFNNTRHLSLIFNRPVSWRMAQSTHKPILRLLSNGVNGSQPEAPLGKPSEEMHGASAKPSNTSENNFSSTHEEQSSDEPLETIILRNSLKFVPEYGFTDEAISKGVADCGLSTASKGIFQNGAFDLIDFFYKKCNAEMAEHLEKLIKEGKITSKNQLVRSALLYRLTLIQPYIKHWPQAMATMSFYPSYAFKSIENLIKLCDEIWHQLGDTSTDWNWYSKRLSLAALYKSTELFMIQDRSENFADTVRFLDNRFKDLAKIGEINRRVSDVGQAVTGSLTVLKNIMNIRN